MLGVGKVTVGLAESNGSLSQLHGGDCFETDQLQCQCSCWALDFLYL